MIKRCGWVNDDPLVIEYHDKEWGVPVHDDLLLFEFLVLEGVQAGLSWTTVLKKRENYREAFDHFDPRKIARYDEARIEELLNNPGIIRNKLKIEAAIANATAFLRVQSEFCTFDRYIWQFVDGGPVCNRWAEAEEIPAKTSDSDLMAKDLKRRGFKFVGPTICYAFMQAVGMVNDHTTDCFRYEEVRQILASSYGERLSDLHR